MIPSVDLSPFFVDEGVVIGDAPTESQRTCASLIDNACRQHGFLHVTGFGVTQDLYDRAFAASKALFDQPDNATNCRPWHPSHNMGYSPYRTESLNPNRPAEWKEAFNVRFPPAHDNDYQGCPNEFSAVANELQECFRTATHRYALACALALSLPIDFFAQNLPAMDLCTIRFLHYPPCPEAVLQLPPASSSNDNNSTSTTNVENSIRVGEHTDFGAYTLLLLGPRGAEGLQIQPVEHGAIGGKAGGESNAGWIDVEVPIHTTTTTNTSTTTPSTSSSCTMLCSSPGAIVNTGPMMARWTNDVWRATAHRVIIPSEVEASRGRYSMAMFVDADAKSVVRVHASFVTDETPCRYKPITGKDYLQMKLREMANPKVKS